MTAIKVRSFSFILLTFLSVGQLWTQAIGQLQTETSFTSQFPMTTVHSTSSYSSIISPVKAVKVESETGPLKEGEISFSSSSSPLSILIRRPRMQSSSSANSRIPTSTKISERDLITRVRSLPNEKLNRYKIEAARQLQASLIRTFQVLSSSANKLPQNVQIAAKRALVATQAGNYNPAIVRHLPGILKHGSRQQGQPAKQLQMIIASIMPHVPSASRGSLQGILGFLNGNLVNVNNLLVRVLGTVPDLLAGVIRSLTLNLGAVTGALTGTVASIGGLLGGVLG